MACKPVCKFCRQLVFSQAVTFAAGTLTINIPAGSYANGCMYCIAVVQDIPAEATITAPVVITIGDGTAEYPLIGSCCQQITACGIRSRTRYKTKVVTDATGGSFRLMGKACCSPNYALAGLDGTVPAAEGGAGA